MGPVVYGHCGTKSNCMINYLSHNRGPVTSDGLWSHNRKRRPSWNYFITTWGTPVERKCMVQSAPSTGGHIEDMTLLVCKRCRSRATWKDPNPGRRAPLRRKQIGYPNELIGLDIMGPPRETQGL
ncbi:hypothetical protein FGIG_00538 [Fasciola gigantica]|uniref:Uncharacterized protein n=1 Tax=Fasciola gigantica TaxID=46835 RepID=A0A504YPC3_FASGI|nr:hypothetical protein FGIG_00538 [Fasciola gigantica]